MQFPDWLSKVLFGAMSLCACVSFPDAPEPIAPPVLAGNVVQTIDGSLLGVRSWQAENPRAIIIAVHGMNDYGRAFEQAGQWWSQNASITTYAFDQRGFGRSPEFGRWAGAATMSSDLVAVISAIRRQHADAPIFVLGHSMGAAVVMRTAREAALEIDGLILAAPGVWGGRALPLPLRASANFAAMIAPGKTLTGERAGKQATDNIEILREMFADPLVIKETRIDSILGVIRVMGDAYNNADDVSGNILFLIGEKDEIIPSKAMDKTAARLNGDKTIRRYPDGWHLLFRDLQAETVWRDVAEWIDSRIAGGPDTANREN